VPEYVSAVTQQAREVLAPLEEAEAQRAVRAALERVGAEVEAELRGYELLFEKARQKGGVPLRRVRVLVGEAARDVVYEVIVDADGEVVSAEPREGQTFPLLLEEIARAEEIAARDERVARLLEQPDVGAGAFHPPRHEAAHRLVGLHYMRSSDPAAIEVLATVVVDLATEEVASFTPDEGSTDRRSGG
jgi:hypothetical protein